MQPNPAFLHLVRESSIPTKRQLPLATPAPHTNLQHADFELDLGVRQPVSHLRVQQLAQLRGLQWGHMAEAHQLCSC